MSLRSSYKRMQELNRISHQLLVLLLIFVMLTSLSTLTTDFPTHHQGQVQSRIPDKLKPTDSIAMNTKDTTVTFQETGLESGTTWSVDIESWDPVSYVFSESLSSNTNTITASLSPETYDVTFNAEGHYAPVNMGVMQIQVTNQSSTVYYPFQQQFPVTVNEIGIPINMSWGFTLNNVPSFLLSELVSGSCSSSNTIYVVNGTYQITAGLYDLGDNGVNIFGNSQNVSVEGGPVSLTLSFYRVTLSERGLPNNVSWGFYPSSAIQLPNGTYYIPGGLYPGNASYVTLYLPDGSTFFQPVAKGFYSPGIWINVSNSGAAGIAVFQKEYPVTFQVSVPLPWYWQWWIEGIPYTFDGSPGIGEENATQTYMLPSGIYEITVLGSGSYDTKINGTEYKVSLDFTLANRTLTVSGEPVNINVTVTTRYVNTNSLSYQLYSFLAINWGSFLAISILIGLIATVFILGRNKSRR